MTSPPQDVTHLVSHALMKTTTSSLEATSSRTTASTTEVAANVTGPSINSLGFDGNPFYTYHPVQVFLISYSSFGTEQLLVINGYLTNGVYAQIERANLSNLTDVHECLLLDGFNNQMEKFTLNIVQNHLMQCGGVIWGRPGGNGTNNDTLDAYASLNCAYRNLSFPMLQYPRVLATSVLIPPNRIFIAGGEVPGSHSLLKSTEIIQFSDDFKEIHSIRGPDMPLPLNHNCLIFDPELEILMSIGGRSLYDGDQIPIGISMILHLNESSSWMYGPPLKQKRLGHSCGLLKLANTTVVVVAGGISGFRNFPIPLDSVEMLVHGENGIGKYWQTGPPLPKAVYYGSPAMMSLESSLLLSHQHSLFKLNCSTTAATSSLTDECHWTEAAQVWQNPYILSHIFILHSDLEKKLTCQ